MLEEVSVFFLPKLVACAIGIILILQMGGVTMPTWLFYGMSLIFCVTAAAPYISYLGYDKSCQGDNWKDLCKITTTDLARWRLLFIGFLICQLSYILYIYYGKNSIIKNHIGKHLPTEFSVWRKYLDILLVVQGVIIIYFLLNPIGPGKGLAMRESDNILGRIMGIILPLIVVGTTLVYLYRIITFIDHLITDDGFMIPQKISTAVPGKN